MFKAIDASLEYLTHSRKHFIVINKGNKFRPQGNREKLNYKHKYKYIY